MKKISKNTRKAKKKRTKKSKIIDLGGRPTKYRVEFCKEIIQHCKAGGCITSFAESIAVHKDTLYEWRKHHAAFSDSMNRARQVNFLWWRKILQAAALGKKIKGSFFAPNMSAIIFAMKNECGWSDNPEEEEDIIDEVLF